MILIAARAESGFHPACSNCVFFETILLGAGDHGDLDGVDFYGVRRLAFLYQHSSLLVEPLLRWLFPHLSEAQIHAVHELFRKGAHLAEYSVFAFVALARAPQTGEKRFPSLEPWRKTGSRCCWSCSTRPPTNFANNLCPPGPRWFRTC